MSDETTPPPRRRGEADDALRGRDVRNWWGILIGVAGALVVAGGTYTSFKLELAGLDKRLVSVEAARAGDANEFAKLNKRIDRLDRKLELILCATDKAACTSNLLVGSAAPGEP
jgi:hypothetical protein